MKTVGIIGGLGPETTSKFYLEVSLSCQDKNKTNRPPMLIYSVPGLYLVEQKAIVEGRGENLYVPLLTDAAKILESAGADFLVMPCNSLHEFINDIRDSVKIPVLSIVDETTRFLKREGIAKVGIISTSITLDKKLYENSFLTNGIEQVKPEKSQQARLGSLIYNLVSNKYTDEDRERLADIIDSFETRGIEHVILACTDLQLLQPQHQGIKIFDTLKILSNATVQQILS